MRKKKQILSLVLAALMGFAGLPAAVHGSNGQTWDISGVSEAAPTLMSMVPMEEKSIWVDLDGYLPSELKAFPVSKFVEILRKAYPYYTFGEALAIANCYEGAGDDFQILEKDGVIDLSSDYEYDRWGYYSNYYELISGDSTDQLETYNTRYRLSVYVNNDKVLNVPEIADSSRSPIEISSTYIGVSGYMQDGVYKHKNYLDVSIYEGDWPENQELFIRLQPGASYVGSGRTAEIYEGYYESAEEIPEDAKNITEQIFGAEDLTVSGGYPVNLDGDRPEMTVVFSENGEAAGVFPFELKFYRTSISLSHSYSIYADNGYGGRRDISRSTSSNSSNGLRTCIMDLDPGYAADGEYYYNCTMYHPTQSTSGYGVELVEKAVVGDYTNVENIRSEELADIKEQLFSSASSNGGYAADYSNGVTFSILDIEGDIHRIYIKTQEYVVPEEGGLPAPPRPLSSDTYFQAQGVDVQQEDGSRKWVSYYQMPYEADAYYYNGYQTVFLMDEDEDGNAVPLEDGSTIYPHFWTGNKVHMYATHDTTAGDLQESGNTPHTFQSGEVIQYAAAAENMTHLKNYWVTYLTQQTDPDAPKLFINGANDESRYITVDGEELYQRELFLFDGFGNYHDIFFANIGSKDLEGMYVRLEDPVNVALDEYWTLEDGSSLSAFTTTENRTPNGNNAYYGNLANFGKVRLRTDLEAGDSAFGAISGTLVIGYTGTASSGDDAGEAEAAEVSASAEEYRIVLSGFAANPNVTTAVLADAVKYVPYSQLIMTNNMYDNDQVKFEIVSGSLPAGIELRPNGELYGLPIEVGTYNFRVKVTFTSEVYGITITDTHDYTINVLDNTDTNVFWTNEMNNQGYAFVEENEIAMVGMQVPWHEILYHVWVDEDSYLMVEFDDLLENYEVVEEYELELFWSHGPHDEQFMYFFLDGQELVPGVDYTSEEGSTKINIRSQTFRDAGEGHHTIAAEFRTGKVDDGIMKRTSQNVYVHNTTADVPEVPDNPSSFDDFLSDMLELRERDQKSESSSNKQHSITFVQNEGGTVESSYWQAMEGTLVTITVSVFSDFRLKTIEAVSKAGEVSLTKISDTEYVFTMPGAPVEIRTFFEFIESASSEDLPFTDVHRGDWFFESVAYVYNRGLMSGTDRTSFSPSLPASRAMLVTVLYRMAGEPAVYGSTSFADVESGSYYSKAVVWAMENGIVTGYNEQYFGSEESITREQVAAILFRYAAYIGRDTRAANLLINYLDADQISAYAVPAMEWANAEGLILGMTENTLNPAGEATRAQIAAILARFHRGE